MPERRPQCLDQNTWSQTETSYPPKMTYEAFLPPEIPAVDLFWSRDFSLWMCLGCGVVASVVASNVDLFPGMGSWLGMSELLSYWKNRSIVYEVADGNVYKKEPPVMFECWMSALQLSEWVPVRWSTSALTVVRVQVQSIHPTIPEFFRSPNCNSLPDQHILSATFHLIIFFQFSSYNQFS
jgi:hypothetical protein